MAYDFRFIVNSSSKIYQIENISSSEAVDNLVLTIHFYFRFYKSSCLFAVSSILSGVGWGIQSSLDFPLDLPVLYLVQPISSCTSSSSYRFPHVHYSFCQPFHVLSYNMPIPQESWIVKLHLGVELHFMQETHLILTCVPRYSYMCLLCFIQRKFCRVAHVCTYINAASCLQMQFPPKPGFNSTWHGRELKYLRCISLT